MNPLTVGLVIETRDLMEQTRLALGELPVRVVLEQAAIGDSASFLARLEQARPAVLLLELSALGGPVEKVFREIKSSPAAPVLVALDRAAEVETVLAAVRAGAIEYLFPPFEDKLRATLDRISAELRRPRAPTPPGAKTLGFFSAKGGCGATTIACHLAAELQRQTSAKILLADLDMESGLIRFFMKAKSDYSVLDAVNNIDRLDFNFWRALISNGQPRLEVIAAPRVNTPFLSSPEDSWRQVVRFVRARYDWVLADLGRVLSPPASSVLEEIDESFLVTTMDVPALFQAKQVLQTMLDRGYRRDRLHVLLNGVLKQTEITVHDVETMLGLPVYAALPNEYAALYEAYSDGRLLPSDSGLGVQFSRLAAKIAGLPEPKKKRGKFSFLG